MADPGPYRYRIEFAKTAAMRFTGHLDLHRTWERIFRRAGLPLAYTQGFSPHPKMTIGAALPLGCTSEHDLIDVWLDEPVDSAAIETRLHKAVPPGVEVRGIETLAPGWPSLPNQVRSAEYQVRSPDFPPAAEMERRVRGLLDSPALPRTRRGKAYDLRPLVEALQYDRDLQILTMRLAAREGASGRPDEVLQAMDLDPQAALATRTRLHLEDPGLS